MNRRDNLAKITITKATKEKIKALAINMGLKQITVLEYLLNGKIDLNELYEPTKIQGTLL